jgi:hypothetical protein
MYKTVKGIIARRIHTSGRAELITSRARRMSPCKSRLQGSVNDINIYEDCKRRNKNFSVAWIDYQKVI